MMYLDVYGMMAIILQSYQI